MTLVWKSSSYVFSILFQPGKQAEENELSSVGLRNLCPASSLTRILLWPRRSHIRPHPQLKVLMHSPTEHRSWPHQHTMSERICGKKTGLLSHTFCPSLLLVYLNSICTSEILLICVLWLSCRRKRHLPGYVIGSLVKNAIVNPSCMKLSTERPGTGILS